MSEGIGPPTKEDLGVAIEILKRYGVAGVQEVALRGSGPETTQLLDAVESVTRVVEYLRGARNTVLPELVPLHGASMRRQWKPDERVELVEHTGPYGPERTRPGVVVSVDEELRRHERLRVRFDDGEERYINPDVMRHV